MMLSQCHSLPSPGGGGSAPKAPGWGETHLTSFSKGHPHPTIREQARGLSTSPLQGEVGRVFCRRRASSTFILFQTPLISLVALLLTCALAAAQTPPPRPPRHV